MIISVVYLFLFISNCVCILYMYMYYMRDIVYIYILPHHIYSYCIIPHQRVCNIERKKILIQYVSQLKYTENRECQ